MACWSVSSLAWCILIRVTATLSIMSVSLLLQSSHSMIVIFGLEDVGYGYVIKIIAVFILPLALTFVNVLLVLVYKVQTQYQA
jgi:hypothetical protein